MIPPAPRILPECLGGAGNCAASDGLRRRAFSFVGTGSCRWKPERGRWLPANAPNLPVGTPRRRQWRRGFFVRQHDSASSIWTHAFKAGGVPRIRQSERFAARDDSSQDGERFKRYAKAVDA